MHTHDHNGPEHTHHDHSGDFDDPRDGMLNEQLAQINNLRNVAVTAINCLYSLDNYLKWLEDDLISMPRDTIYASVKRERARLADLLKELQ